MGAQAGSNRAMRGAREGVRSSRRARRNDSSTPPQQLLAYAGSVGGLVSGRLKNHRRAVAIVAVIAVAVVMLYGPARDWYVAVRRGQDLSVRYEALAEQNEGLEHDLNRLQTRDGIEDEARKRGYIYEGETGVVVENLPEELVDSTVDVIETPNAEDTRSVGVRVLDFVFGYGS